MQFQGLLIFAKQVSLYTICSQVMHSCLLCFALPGIKKVLIPRSKVERNPRLCSKQCCSNKQFLSVDVWCQSGVGIWRKHGIATECFSSQTAHKTTQGDTATMTTFTWCTINACDKRNNFHWIFNLAPFLLSRSLLWFFFTFRAVALQSSYRFMSFNVL